MIELQDYFLKYMKQYVSILTKGKEEFFLSLCDIEEDLLQGLTISDILEYPVVVVDRNDYSEAVRLRNDVDVKQIVLLSVEGIKQIDSLKDFNEYSILSEERSQIWECLQKVFELSLEADVRVFLEIILAYGGISFWDLLRYLHQCIDYNKLSIKKLNRNLPMLEIWKSNSNSVLGKTKIHRMINGSKYSVIENRLTKAVMNGGIKKPTMENIITSSLSQGNIQRLLEKIYYEDVEELLKNAPRSVRGDVIEDNNTAEVYYEYSYEYKLLEHVEEDITSIEDEWMQERNEEDTEFEYLNWGRYQPINEDIKIYERQLLDIVKYVENMNLPSEKIIYITEKLNSLSTEFTDVWHAILKITPICLQAFCKSAEKYTQIYIELLAYILIDVKVRYAIAGTKIVQKLQSLFCEIRKDKIRMPFYHPICVFYYMEIEKMYENIMNKQDTSDISQLKNRIQNALIKKISMQFPIDFINFDDKQYALDYSTVGQSGNVEFTNIDSGIVYSVLDFRVVQKQVLDYIKNHPLMTEITISLIDISDMGGIQQLVDRIRKISKESYCNIGKVDFLILSPKEEELKKKMSQIWDVIGKNDIVRFRFGYNAYCYNKQYDINRIVSEVDMCIMADSSVLYHAPRIAMHREDNNGIQNRLEKMNLLQQLETYFQQGISDIPILWDTLQHVSEKREEGFWRWRSKEIDNNIMTFIDQNIAADKNKSIVILSSNEHILYAIFKTKYIKVHQRKYNGKSITILSFDLCNHTKKIPNLGELKITYYFDEFYNTALELKDIHEEIQADISDIFLEIYYEKEALYCKCSAHIDEDIDISENWVQRCNNWLDWQMGEFLEEDNILSDYFRELLLSQWYEEINSLPAVLMIEKLCKGSHIHFQSDKKSIITSEDKNQLETYCMEAVKIHELIGFVENKVLIDERAVSQFQERHEVDMLERILDCDSKYLILNQKVNAKLFKIHERIKCS